MPLLSWLLFVVAISSVACTHSRQPSPSTTRARTPTPGSITPHNPAGDAAAKEDAALTRLLNANEGVKRDKFNSLRVRLPDSARWRRVRVWGTPMRAAFRYGKKHYAIAVVDYRDASDDEPTRCLERFAATMRSKADSFDMDLSPFERSLSRHWRGVESVDWKKRATKRRLLQRKWRTMRQRKRQPSPRARAAARQKRQLLIARLRTKMQQIQRSRQGLPPATFDERIARLRNRLLQIRAHLHAPTLRRRPAAKKVGHKKVVTTQNGLRKTVETRNGQKVVKVERSRPRPRYRPTLRPRYGYHPMPVIRTEGQFSTLFDRERYIGAIVAHRSWPGTCLVYGFAVRVGSDEMLARRVVDRWVTHLASKLAWRHQLRRAPKRQNR